MMEKPKNFKEALLENPKPKNSELESNSSSNVHVLNEGSSNGLPTSLVPSVHAGGDGSFDPPPPPTFPEVVILDNLPQVQLDIAELSKSCLIGKMLSALVDLRTIIARSKANWRFVKGDIDYLEMGNNLILIRFSNPQDLSLVWSERPWLI